MRQVLPKWIELLVNADDCWTFMQTFAGQYPVFSFV